MPSGHGHISKQLLLLPSPSLLSSKPLSRSPPPRAVSAAWLLTTLYTLATILSAVAGASRPAIGARTARRRSNACSAPLRAVCALLLLSAPLMRAPRHPLLTLLLRTRLPRRPPQTDWQRNSPSTAFAPENMVPSSSSGPPAIEVLSTQTLRPLAMEPPPEAPLCIDKFVVETGCHCRASEIEAVSLSESPPSPPLPSQATAPVIDCGVHTGLDAFDGSGEEYASGELNNTSSDGSGSSWLLRRPSHVDAWVSPGREALTQRLLFAFIEPPVPMLEVSPFIRKALRSVAPLLPVDLLPSSRGAMLLRCASLADRDALHLLGPIFCDGSQLHFQKPEETSNRFFRIPTWLAFVAVTDFPNEHWYKEKIKKCFSSFGEVAEIDPECLTGENFASLRLLLEVNDRLEIPREVRISNKQGLGRFGAVATIAPIRVWPREYQLDSGGNLARFFGPLRAPESGPNEGPWGPVSRQQQMGPQPHFYNEMYAPHRAPSDAHNLQYCFDPLGSSQPAAPLPALHDHLPSSQIMGLALAFARLLARPADPPAPETPPLSLESPVPPVSPCRNKSPSLITYRRRRVRTSSRPAAPQCSSSRIAAKASASFVDMTTQAV